MRYQPPYGSIDPNAIYVDGNPVLGQPGSIIPAKGVEEPQREILGAIMAAGLVPADGAPYVQLTQAIELLGRTPFVVDQGVANALLVNPVPPWTAYSGPNPEVIAVQVAATNLVGGCVVNISGLGNMPLTRVDGTPLLAGDLVAGGIVLIAQNATDTGFQLISVPGSLAFPTPQQLWHYGVDVGATNAVSATIDAIGAAYPTGIPVALKIAHTNTGAVTVALNGIASKPLNRGSGGALVAGDIAIGYIALIMYDGVEWQLINFLNGAGGGAGGNDITGPNRPYWISVISQTTATPPGSPSLGDTYLIPAGATGAWAGLQGRLTQWNGTSWVFRSYPVSSIIGVGDTMTFMECTVAGTTWIPVRIPTAGSLFFYGQL